MRRNRAARFQLSAVQARQIHDTAKALPVWQRHSFLLRVGRTLNVSTARRGPVTDLLIIRAIENALAEVAA